MDGLSIFNRRVDIEITHIISEASIIDILDFKQGCAQYSEKYFMAKKKIIISKTLPALLKAKNITAKQLATKAQVPQSTVATWLIEGARPRNIEDVAEAAMVLEVSLNHLLFGEAINPRI